MREACAYEKLGGSADIPCSCCVSRPKSIDHVVSFSHFVPDIRLVPEKRNLFFPLLMKASGSCVSVTICMSIQIVIQGVEEIAGACPSFLFSF